MNRTLIALTSILLCVGTTMAAEPAKVTIGAVAYAPSAVTIFDGLTKYLNKNGYPCDYVLYSNYDSLVAALEKGTVDIAWNTPLAHGQYHVQNHCASQTLVMRDVDQDVRSVLLVRKGSGIDTLADLKGNRLILGSSQAAEATVLPIYFLKKVGVELDSLKVVSLEDELDNEGNPCASPQHVLQALKAGRGDAGIVTASLWNRVKDDPSITGKLTQVWVSPPFSHCVFTASKEFDKAKAAEFTILMTAMDPTDPATAKVMQLEGTKQWKAGSPDGFKVLVEALQKK